MKHLIYSSSIVLLTLAALLSGGCKKDKADSIPTMFLSGEITLTDMPAAGAEKTISIASNVPWEVTGATDWCKVEPRSGTGNETVVVTISENDTPDRRSAELTVTADGFDPARIEVSQKFNMLNTLKDANLRDWFDREFSGGTGLIEDVSEITRIVLEAPVGRTIKSLEGIENFHNLEYFHFSGGWSGGDLGDVKPFDFSVFPKLADLTISYTSTITSFSVLNMFQLKSLNISNNPNLTTVEGLPDLRDKLDTFFCNDTAIGPELDISPFRKLIYFSCRHTNIKTLYVWWNPLQGTPEQFDIFWYPQDTNLVKR